MCHYSEAGGVGDEVEDEDAARTDTGTREITGKDDEESKSDSMIAKDIAAALAEAKAADAVLKSSAAAMVGMSY